MNTFKIIPRDKQGSERKIPEDEFDIEIDSIEQCDTNKCSYLPTKEGEYLIGLSVNGVKIKNSLDAVSNQSNKFQIIPKDKGGKKLDNLSDDFTVDIDGPIVCLPYITKDEINKLYNVEYVPMKEGDYSIGINYKGNMVKGKPFKILKVQILKKLK